MLGSQTWRDQRDRTRWFSSEAQIHGTIRYLMALCCRSTWYWGGRRDISLLLNNREGATRSFGSYASTVGHVLLERSVDRDAVPEESGEETGAVVIIWMQIHKMLASSKRNGMSWANPGHRVPRRIWRRKNENYTGLSRRSEIPSRVIKLAASWLEHDNYLDFLSNISVNSVNSIITMDSINSLSSYSKAEWACPKKSLKVEASVARLEDKNQDVRWVADVTLRSQSSLSDEILTALVARLEGKNPSVRQAAVRVLGYINRAYLTRFLRF